MPLQWLLPIDSQSGSHVFFVDLGYSCGHGSGLGIEVGAHGLASLYGCGECSGSGVGARGGFRKAAERQKRTLTQIGAA